MGKDSIVRQYTPDHMPDEKAFTVRVHIPDHMTHENGFTVRLHIPDHLSDVIYQIQSDHTQVKYAINWMSQSPP